MFWWSLTDQAFLTKPVPCRDAEHRARSVQSYRVETCFFQKCAPLLQQVLPLLPLSFPAGDCSACCMSCRGSSHCLALCMPEEEDCKRRSLFHRRLSCWADASPALSSISYLALSARTAHCSTPCTARRGPYRPPAAFDASPVACRQAPCCQRRSTLWHLIWRYCSLCLFSMSRQASGCQQLSTSAGSQGMLG